MRKLSLLLLLLAIVLVPVLVLGQGGNTISITGSGAPTGTCSFIFRYIDSATGNQYNCKAGAWNLIGGGPGSGASTSRVMVTSTYTNATTTASNVTGLSFAVAASTNYAMRCELYYQGSAGTAGLDITLTGPASPTSVFYSYDEASTVTGIQDGVASAFSTKLVGNTTVTATTNLHAQVTMGLRNGINAGTVQVQGSATGTGTVTVQAGSYCVLQ